MPAATTKRRSESALTIHKTKSRKISPASDNDEYISDNSGGLFVSDRSPSSKHVRKTKTRKSDLVRNGKEKKGRNARSDEYEDDPGRDDGTDFLAAVRMQASKASKEKKAKAAYLGNYAKRVKDNEAALSKELENAKRASQNGDKEFLANFKQAFVSSRPGERSSNENNYRPFNSLYKDTQVLTEAAYALIEDFAKGAKEAEEIKKSIVIDNEWGAADDEMAVVLKAGHTVAMERYEALLHGRRSHAVDSTINPAVKALFETDDEMPIIGWGRLVHKQQKGLAKLVKANEMAPVPA